MILDLETDRLRVRPFAPSDLADASRIFGDADDGSSERERAEWMAWSTLNYSWLDRLKQPPFGDYAIVGRQTGFLIGACGYVPSMAPFAQVDFAPIGSHPQSTRHTFEIGLYYHVDPSHRRLGYATEAARALIQYARDQLRVARIVATTTYDNHGSIGVMAKLGMRIGRNRLSTPPWLQVVGMIDFE